MLLITAADLETITGLSDDDLVALIPYSQAQAKAMLGFLVEETKTYEKYIEEDTREVFLDDKPINSIESVEYSLSATDDPEVLEDYRSILSKGLIVLDQLLRETSIVSVSYIVGWTHNTVPDLVKTFLCVLAVNHYYSLFPDRQITSNIIVQERIGDYMVKYSGYVKGTYKSMDEWVDYLVELIKNGEMYTSAE